MSAHRPRRERRRDTEENLANEGGRGARTYAKNGVIFSSVPRRSSTSYAGRTRYKYYVFV